MLIIFIGTSKILFYSSLLKKKKYKKKLPEAISMRGSGPQGYSEIQIFFEFTHIQSHFRSKTFKVLWHVLWLRFGNFSLFFQDLGWYRFFGRGKKKKLISRKESVLTRVLLHLLTEKLTFFVNLKSHIWNFRVFPTETDVMNVHKTSLCWATKNITAEHP